MQLGNSADPHYLTAWEDLNCRIRKYRLVEYSLWLILIFLLFSMSMHWSRNWALIPIGIYLLARHLTGKAIAHFHCPRCNFPFMKFDPTLGRALGILLLNAVTVNYLGAVQVALKWMMRRLMKWSPIY